MYLICYAVVFAGAAAALMYLCLYTKTNFTLLCARNECLRAFHKCMDIDVYTLCEYREVGFRHLLHMHTLPNDRERKNELDAKENNKTNENCSTAHSQSVARI